MMRILFDGNIFSLHQYGGITRYICKLIESLPSSVKSCLTVDGNIDFSGDINNPNAEINRFHHFRPRRISSRLKNQWFFMCRKKFNPDLIHLSYYGANEKGLLKKKPLPLVLTVYDMIHEKYPAQLDAEGQMARQKEVAIRQADRIICISENTKKDLVSLYPEFSDKTEVVYLAGSFQDGDENASNVVMPENISQPYYLFIGRRPDYKGFKDLIQAMSIVSRKNRKISLCAVGPPPTSGEIEYLKKIGLLDHFKFISEIDDLSLIGLYKHSIGLVYPSHYEGFGIPPLEAMTLGTPVILAKNSSLTEIACDAGIYFRTGDHSELAEKMLQLLDDSSLRDTFTAKGKLQSSRFTWEHVARETCSVYENLLCS